MMTLFNSTNKANMAEILNSALIRQGMCSKNQFNNPMPLDWSAIHSTDPLNDSNQYTKISNKLR